MQARLLAYVPDGAAISRIVPPAGRLLIGRDPDCDVVIEHPSVSRRHAELHPRGGGWWLLDTDSKNGTFVNGGRVGNERLPETAWLRFGDVHCEFAAISDESAAQQAQRMRDRRTQATQFTVRLDALGAPGGSLAGRGQELLEHSLKAIVELAQCTRGFLLVVENGRYRVAAAQMAGSETPGAQAQFGGSHGAVERALNTRRAVVFNDVGQEAWLAERASVLRGGLRTLVALPLLDGTRPLGAIYADRTEAGAPLTTLDVELLQAFAERCALWLAASREADSKPTPAPPSEAEWPALMSGRNTLTR